VAAKRLYAKPIAPDLLGEYDRLASEHGILFDRIAWTDSFADRIQRYGVFDGGGSLRGGFALYSQRRFGLRIVRTPPFSSSCGPFFNEFSKNFVSRIEERRALLQCMISVIERQRPAVVSLALPSSIVDIFPFYLEKFKVIPQFSYIVDLHAKINQILGNSKHKFRKDISNAKKDGVNAQLIESPDRVSQLAGMTFERQNKSVDMDAYSSIVSGFARSDNSYSVVTTAGSQDLSGIFVVHDKDTAYGILSGFNHQIQQRGAAAFALFEAVKHAKALGLSRFDTRGSVIPSIEGFLRGLGGCLVPYHTINRAWFPLEVFLKIAFRNRF
jgi:Acetyltransferase (GNAT) domain